MRPVPASTKAVPIRSFTLRAAPTTRRKADYDWIYNFRLLAEAEGVGTMYASGECPWYAKDKVLGLDKRKITGSTTDLSATSTATVAASTSSACASAPAVTCRSIRRHRPQDEGRLRRGRHLPDQGDVAPGIAFRLQTASAEACRPIEECRPPIAPCRAASPALRSGACVLREPGR